MRIDTSHPLRLGKIRPEQPHQHRRNRQRHRHRHRAPMVEEIIRRLQLKAGDNHARFREYLYMLEVLASNRGLEKVAL